MTGDKDLFMVEYVIVRDTQAEHVSTPSSALVATCHQCVAWSRQRAKGSYQCKPLVQAHCHHWLCPA
jgi:hypothetical protein